MDIILKLSIYFIITFCIFFVLLFLRKEYLIEKELHKLSDTVETNYELTEYFFHKNTQNINDLVTKDQLVIEIMEKASNSDKKNQDILRDQLYKHLLPTYMRMKNQGVLQFHFVLPNNHSFLRMHLPLAYGDNLSQTRYSYNYVNKYKKPVQGFENGKSSHAFRYLYPLFKNEKYLGAFEVSFPVKEIQESLIEHNKVHTHFLVKKELLDRRIYKNKELSNNYTQSIEHDDYMFTLDDSDEHLELKKWGKGFINKIKPDITENMNKQNKFSLYIKTKDGMKVISFFPVKNTQNKVNAYLVAYLDSPYIQNIIANFYLINLILFMLLLFFFAFIYMLMTQKQNLKTKINEAMDIISKHVIYSKTDKKGNITEISDAFSEISGYKKEELIGEHHRIVRHPDFENERLFSKLRKALDEEKTFRGTFKNITKDGKTYWLDTIITPEYDSNGKFKDFIALRYDITDKIALKELNKNLKEKVKKGIEINLLQEKKLLKQEKIASLGKMMDAIAHQWKQPLNTISIHMDTLEIKYEINNKLSIDEILEVRDITKEQIEHLITTIDEFRSFFRPNQKLQKVNMQELIESTLNLLKSDLMKNEIETNIVSNEDIELNCIENEFKHIFINLISNSIDAFNENSIENKKITFYLEENKNEKIIKICDNAGGIDKSIIDKIFESDFTTKEEGKGTGIGLYLTRQIIDKIQGTILAKNIDNGVCFIIKI